MEANSIEVTRLRKAGQLQEALSLAEQLMQADPDNLYNRRAFAWVLYALLKTALTEQKPQEAQAYLQAFDDLKMPAEEDMLHNSFNYFRPRLQPQALQAETFSQKGEHAEALERWWMLLQEDPGSPTLPAKIAWELWKWLRALPPFSKAHAQMLGLWLDRYKKLDTLERPSPVHSALLQQILRLPEEWRNEINLAAWFQYWRIPEDFSEKDWQPYIMEKGAIPPLAERACNAWCKALIRHGRELPAAEVQEALQKLEAISHANPGFVWLPYFIAKIRIEALRDTPEKARETLLPFVRKKHKDFWAWDLLADTFSAAERPMQEACLCKALSCQAAEHFLPKVRLRLARLLIEQQDWPKARFEMAQVEQLKMQRKERVPQEILLWITREEVQQAPLPDVAAQQAYYRAKAKEAEALVFGKEQQTLTAVIEGVDANTGNVFFAATKDIRGRFPGAKFRAYAFEPGAHYDLSLTPYDREGQRFWKVLRVAPPSGAPSKEVFRIFAGKLRKQPQQPFGFVDEAFIPPALLQAADVTPGQLLAAAAIWAYDPKKKQYGWKAIKIE